jgi:hypothetical protein
MEKFGESLNNNFFTFKYPGREPKLIKEFLLKRPDILNFYIYDIDLTTGTLLYSCKGGIGVTKERYVVDMHLALQNPAFSSALKDDYLKAFGDRPTKRKYFALRDQFNSSVNTNLSFRKAINLYVLWASSNYLQIYKEKGYNSIYLPSLPLYDCIRQASLISRQKKLLFRKEDVFTLSESLIFDNVVVYMHIPDAYGVYGAGFTWTEKKFLSTINVLKEFDSLGHKVCVSATQSKYGRLYRDYSESFSEFLRIEVPGFKGSELTTESSFSEVYFLNF